MRVQQFELTSQPWQCIFIYDAGEDDAEIILSLLHRAGCSGLTKRKAERNLRSGMLDTGLTYTNEKGHVSISVIGKASSGAEFWNTLDHEKGHMVMHIAEALHVDPYGEKYEYLAGEIARHTYDIARLYL